MLPKWTLLLATLLPAAAGCASNPAATATVRSPLPVASSPAPSPLDPVTAAYYKVLEDATKGEHQPSGFDTACNFTLTAECRGWAIQDKAAINQMLAVLATAQPPPSLAAANSQLPALLRALLTDDDALIASLDSKDQARIKSAIDQLLKDGGAVGSLFNQLDPNIQSSDVP